MNKLSILLLGTLCSVASLSAQTTKARSLPILEMAVDTRSAALGGNHYGESHTSYLYANPTSLLYCDEGNLSASASARFLGKIEGFDGSRNLFNLALGARLGDHGFFLGGRYLGGLKFQEVDQAERVKKTYTIEDYTIDVGYALRLSSLSAYVMGSYISTSLKRSASTFVVGVGAFYRSRPAEDHLGLSYTIGAKAQNLGGSYRYTSKGSDAYPPAFFGLGGELGYGISAEHHLALALGADYFFYPSNSRSTALHVGGEYLFRQAYALRLGYFYDSNGAKHFSAGAGLRFKPMNIDLAYLAPSAEGLKAAFQLTIGVNLGVF